MELGAWLLELCRRAFPARFLLILSISVLLPLAARSSCLDPFSDATGSGGTSYTPGSFLMHQINALGNEWFALTNTPTPPATGIPAIVSGNLSYSGLPTSSGNSIQIPSATGVMGRLTLGFVATNGSAYFSFLLKVTDLSNIDFTGTQNNYFAAFGDTTGNQNATLLRAATRIYTRRSGTGFNLGVSRNSNNTSQWVFDTTQRATNTTLLIVGSYNYDNHTANLWINPSSASFRAATPPAPTITATQGSDLNASGIHAFVLGCRTNPPPGCIVDEFRAGTTWAFVTGGLEISTPPTNQAVNAGATASFSVTALGTPPFTYQWLKNGANLANGGNISGATNATLFISDTASSDAGNYSVRVADSLNSVTSSVAILSVSDPAIVSQPSGLALPAGTNAVFHVVAAGTAPLAYQWFKNGSPLANGGNVSGADAATLIISNISATDIASYSVRVTNAFNQSILSTAAALYITDPALTARRPNIIFILCDDLGYGDIGVLFQNARAPGQPREFTPNLDSFAAQSIQLRRHYCPAPLCAPSRASFLMGVHQGHSNVRDQQFEKAIENNHTVASVLKAAGYATACIGKWGLAGETNGTDPNTWPAWPTHRGFDYYFGYIRHGDGHEHYPKEAPYSNGPKECYDSTNNITPTLDKCYTADLFTARAKKWISDQHNTNPNQPFFLYLAYDTPHAVQEYPPTAYPSGGGTNGGLQWLGIPGQMINSATGTIDSYIHPDYANATYDDDNNPSTPEVPYPEVFKRYATSVRRLDDAVGDITKLVQDLAIDTNTMIVFTSDNGPTIEDYLSITPHLSADFFDTFGPMDGIKRDAFEGGIRMPTFVRWPGTITAGAINTNPSQFHDWLPTFTDLVGLPAPARADGVSLVPTLLGVGVQRPSTIYVEYFDVGTFVPSYAEFEPSRRGRARNQMQVIGLNGYQGVRYNILSHSDDFEIYEPGSDPKQATNLASMPGFATLQQQMKDRVLQLRRPNSDTPRPYDLELVPPVGPTAVTNGLLDCAVYEGIWPWAPDVSTLNSAATGHVAGLDLSLRPRDTNYAMSFTGFIRIPLDGEYTFYLSTDSEAVFRIHDATVIDDGFLHTNGELSASIRLKSGLHPIHLTYLHTTGPNILSLQYAGPNLGKQPIPLSAFYSACSACAIAPIANDDAVTLLQTASTNIDVLANDIDDGLPSPLSITSVSTPLAGTASIVSGKILYAPNSNFLGDDFFTYTVTDGAARATGTVHVSVCLSDGSYWFPFNETSGFFTTDASGFTIAPLIGFTNDPVQWVPGRFNHALSFDGISNYVTITNFVGINGTASRTCAAWVKTTSSANIGVMGWGPNTSGNKWSFLIEGGNPRVEITGGWVQASRFVNDGNWHHIACTFADDGTPDATDVKLYIDGTLETVLSSQSSQALNTLPLGPVTIGNDVQGRLFDGVIDEARIYNRALSAAEIAALYSATDQSATAWYRRFFGDASIDWSIDDDHDGASRLLEYAMGGEPSIPDASRMKIAAGIISGHLQVTYNRRIAGSHELTYQLQQSSDLKTWSAFSSTEISAIPADLDGFETATLRANSGVSSGSPFFVRLAVSSQ